MTPLEIRKGPCVSIHFPRHSCCDTSPPKECQEVRCVLIGEELFWLSASICILSVSGPWHCPIPSMVFTGKIATCCWHSTLWAYCFLRTCMKWANELETWHCWLCWLPALWLFLLLPSPARPLMTLWRPLLRDISWLEVCLPFMKKCCPQKVIPDDQKSRNVLGE